MKKSNLKIERIYKFNELADLFESGIYSNKLSFSNPEIIYSQLPTLDNMTDNINISFNQENVIDSIYKSNDAAVLVFCSAKNPGGGVKRGSIAQEEEISLHSSWYFQVKDLNDFYLEKGDSALNSDKMIYIENGYLLKDTLFSDIEPIKISFIGATAPNLNGIRDQHLKFNEKDIYNILEYRIANILKLASLKHKKELILGAFGCGVFGLNPLLVSKIFKEKIEEKLFTGHITFSILDEEILNIFKNTFQYKSTPTKKIVK